MPLVSIIINCYNGEPHLREAIDSVYAQTFDDWEIVFWDDASTDGTAAIARAYDDRLRYYRGEKARSLGEARNFAMGHAEGEFIAFLDADDFWLPTKLEKQLRVLGHEPEASLVYSNYYRIRPDGKQVLALKGQQPSGDVFERFLFHYPVAMSTAVVRNRALQRLEALFDDSLNLSEEFDVFMRMLSTSRAAYVDEPLAAYRVHGKMSSVKLMDRYPIENAYIMEKLRRMDPALGAKYPAALRYMKAKIAYWSARAEMTRGANREARAALAPYRWQDLVFFAMHLLTYLPPHVWLSLHDLRNKGYYIHT